MYSVLIGNKHINLLGKYNQNINLFYLKVQCGSNNTRTLIFSI